MNTQAGTALYAFALMWMPGLAAVLTWRIVGRALGSLGLGHPRHAGVGVRRGGDLVVDESSPVAG